MVPATGLPRVTSVVVAPLQYVSLLTGKTVAVGYTVMVKDEGIPVHPFAAGVTVMVAITGAVPELVAVNTGRLPVPLASRPIDSVLFDQV